MLPFGLGDGAPKPRVAELEPDDTVLLYTDGVTEARDTQRRFYPLTERLADPGGACPTGSGTDLLDWLREDLLRHAGAPLTDDAALLLVGAADVRHDQHWAGVGVASGESAG